MPGLLGPRGFPVAIHAQVKGGVDQTGLGAGLVLLGQAHAAAVDDHRVVVVDPMHRLGGRKLGDAAQAATNLGPDQQQQHGEEAAYQQWVVRRELEKAVHFLVSFCGIIALPNRRAGAVTGRPLPGC